MLADEVDFVVGVDTHRDEHVLAVVAAPAGGVLAQRAVRTNGRGYAEALRFVAEQAPGARVWAVEGVGHYGAGLVRYLSEHGEAVIEIGRGPRDERRLAGKNDLLDAVRAARTALASQTLTLPRAGQRREALRLLLVARRSAIDVRRQALVQLRSVIVTCPDRLREELRTLPTGRLIERCSLLRRPTTAAPTLWPAGSCCERSPDGSRQQPQRPASSNRRSTPTSACSHHSCSTSPASARSSPPRSSLPGHTQAASAQKPPSHASPASHRSPPRAAKQPGTDSAAAATANSTAPSTPSPCTVANTTPQPRTTSHAASARARAAATPPASSSATSPDTSTAYSTTRCR